MNDDESQFAELGFFDRLTETMNPFIEISDFSWQEKKGLWLLWRIL